MNQGTYLFSQLISIISPTSFKTCVKRYNGDYKTKHFNCWRQYLCMVFGQLTHRESLSDTILCLNLKKYHKPILLKENSITSSIRFDKNGYYFQSFLNQLMKIGFYLKIPLPKLNYFYEKSLELNSKLAKK